MAYAQARMQSRHGARPDARAWAQLHATVTLASLLECARASPLGAWAAGLDPAASRVDAERLLAARLADRIAEAARWMPEEWRAAVHFTATLVDLPARQGELRARGDEERAAAVRRAWLARWRALWPPCGEADRAALDELVRAVETHVERFSRAAPDEADGLRLALRTRVEALFRRHALRPAAAFAWLLLQALECERLRAEVVSRAGEGGAA